MTNFAYHFFNPFVMIRLGLIIVILSTFLIISCSKSSSGPSSAEGKWTYTTSDGKITVDFELVKTSSGSLDVQNQSIKINGALYNAEKEITGVNLPTIASIRINANDSKAVYPYYILFSNGKVSGDFKRIDIPDGEYTFPWGTTVTMKSVAIVRP